MNTKKQAPKTDKQPQQNLTFLFGKTNYILMLVGIGVLIVGFTLMSGTEDIYNSTKLTVAPIVVMIGFIIEIVAILYKPKQA